MCCSKRKTAVGCVGLLAILAGICGILMIVFSFILTDSEFIKKIGEAKAFEDVEDSRKFILYGLVTFSVFTMLIALCGCCFKCCKNRCFAVIYGVILTPVWLIVVILGGLAAGASIASEDVVEEQCQKIADRLTIGVDADGNFDLSAVGSSVDAIQGGLVDDITLTSE